MIDKYKYTTLSYSKTGLSCRPFHKEGFYREKPPVHTSFSQFLPSNEAKNAYRMPLGCLSDASKMPSWRDLQAAEQPVTADEACHVAVNMWDFKVSKEAYLPYSAGETIRNRHAIR